jgi:hypothetical protein
MEHCLSIHTQCSLLIVLRSAETPNFIGQGTDHVESILAVFREGLQRQFKGQWVVLVCRIVSLVKSYQNLRKWQEDMTIPARFLLHPMSRNKVNIGSIILPRVLEA